MATLKYALVTILLAIVSWIGIAMLSSEPVTVVYPSNSNGKIAFASNRDSNYEIYVMDADGSDAQRLTSNYGDDIEPDWSPDGMSIAFSSAQNGDFEIYTMDADGSNQRNVTNYSSGNDRYPSWSPDGTHIAFSRRTGLAGSDIYIMNVDGSQLTKVVDGQSEIYNLMPTWSPDGMQLVFSATRELPIWDPLTAFSVNKVSIDGSEAIQIGSAQPYGNPDWSWTLDEIAYYSVDLFDWLLFRMNKDGTNRTQITYEQNDVNRADSDPSWSPDGTKIVFSSITYNSARLANSDIFIINSDGTNRVNLTPTSNAEDITPDWQMLRNPIR